MTDRLDFEVSKSQFSQTRWQTAEPRDLRDGEVECAIDATALTANNITYAAVGEEVGYWAFFPANDTDWGRIPVWGFANVVRSHHPEVEVGERLYGYWPMSTHLVLEPARISRRGWIDGRAHRAGLPAVYNQYQRVAADPLYAPEHEALLALFRPLFMTSFLIDDLLLDNEAFDASTIILSSASARTAYGTAFLMHQRNDWHVVGLTSAGNRAFVESLGCYDSVLSYDELEQLPDGPAVYIDIAGNSDLRRSVHEHFGELLRYSCAVGYSHLGTLRRGDVLPGPEPQFFFAPARIDKRSRDWADSGGVMGHHAQAWHDFLPRIEAEQTIIEHRGAPAIEAAFQAMLAGQASPREGHMLYWQP